MCEIVWRNHHSNRNIYEPFFTELIKVYDLEGEPKLHYLQHIFPYFNPFDDESFEYAGQEEILQSDDADDHIAELPLEESEQSSPLPSPSQQLMSFIPSNECSTPLAMSTATSTISMECHVSSALNESAVESYIVLQPEEPQPGPSGCINDAFVTFRKRKKVSAPQSANWK